MTTKRKSLKQRLEQKKKDLGRKGGGGYILGFTQDFEKAKESLSDYKLEVVYNF